MPHKISTIDLNQYVVGGSGSLSQQNKYRPVSRENIYDFMEFTFEGSELYRDGSGLVPHSREMDYKKRTEIAHYKNFLKPILNAMVEPVFVENAVRKVVDPGDDEKELIGLMVNEFIDDADNDGSSLQEVVEDVVTYARLHGVSFCVVDNFKDEEISSTVQQNIANRTFPYCYMRKANQVYTYALDKYGKIKYIMFEANIEDAEGFAPSDKEEKITGVYQYWDESEGQVYVTTDKHKEPQPVGEAWQHGLGRIPVISVYSVRRKDKSKLLIDPPLYDIAKINYTMFNKDSEIREIERAQGFSFLYAQGIEPGDLTIGTDNYLNLPPDASIPPGYCAPNPEIQKTLMSYNGELKGDLFAIAQQNGVTGVTDQSGIAKQWDFFAHESVLKKTAKIAEALEYAIVDLFQRYTEERFIYVVEYRDEFQPNDTEKEIGVYERYIDLQPVPKGAAHARAAVARLVFRDQPAEQVKQIVDDELSAAADEEQSKKKGDNVPDNIIDPDEDEVVE